jgi:hypothetical protein
MTQFAIEVATPSNRLVVRPTEGSEKRYPLSAQSAYDLSYALLNVSEFSQEQGETLRDLLGLRFPYPPAE